MITRFKNLIQRLIPKPNPSRRAFIKKAGEAVGAGLVAAQLPGVELPDTQVTKKVIPMQIETSPGVAVNRIAIWDGADWKSLESHDEDFYIGGTFFSNG